MKYIVTDSENNVMKTFYNYKDASTYRFSRGNQFWRIKVLW